MQIDKIIEIVKRYELDNLMEEIDSLEKDISLKVGFLGEFSSGKSSLINKLLDKKILPAMNEPTSKTIVEIEGADIEEVEYYKYEGGTKKVISAMEFSDICTTAGDYLAYLRLPIGGFLKKDFLLIDTPGISSIDKSDEDITFGYLPSLDAAVLCQDIQFGALSDSLQNFLLKPEVKPLVNNFIFVITKSDTKQNPEKIREVVMSQLQKLNKTHNLNLANIEKRVIAVSTNKKIDEFSRAFDGLIFKQKQKLQDERRAKEYQSIAQKALKLLKDQKQSATLDLDGIRSEEEEVEADIEALKEGERVLAEKFDKFEEKLKIDIQSILTRRLPELSKVKDEEELLEQMSLVEQSIVQSANDRASRYVGDAGLDTLDGTILAEIRQQINSILNVSNISKQIGTFILVAVIIPGATAAANTAEGAAGMALREAGKKGAKAVAKGAVKEAAKKVALAAVMKNILDIVDKVNPIEIAGNAIQGKVIESKLQDNINSISTNLSFAIRDDLEERLEELFEENRETMQDKRKLLKSLYDKKQGKDIEFSNYMEQLGKDMGELIVDESA